MHAVRRRGPRRSRPRPRPDGRPRPAPSRSATGRPPATAAGRRQPVAPLQPAPRRRRHGRRGRPGAAVAGSPSQPQPPRGQSRRAACSAEAKALYTNGNYPAARQLAEEAKAGKFGVDAQADELLAQIALAEQGGALSLYESALAAMRTGDNGRARALLTEVAAAGDSLDESLRAKVQDLLQKLSADDKAQARRQVGARNAAQDAEALAAQKLNAEVGTKIAEARRLQETDPDKAIALYEQTVQAVKASGLSPDLTRPMVRRLEVAIELAKKDKVAFEAQDAGQAAARRDRDEAAAHPRGRQGQEGADEGADGQGQDRLRRGQLRRGRGLRQAGHGDRSQRGRRLMLVFKAKTERRYKQDLQNRERQGRRHRHGLPGSRHGVDRRPRGPDQRHQVSPRTSRT